MGILKSIQKRIKKKAIKKERKRVIANAASTILSDLKVKHGPFKGMVYPDKLSVGSTFIPKVIGCYEAELHEVINNIKAIEYTSIVDIGCAEGYYAVGLAKEMTNTHIFAYDTNTLALEQCAKMFKLNKVESNRYKLGEFCDEDEILNIDLGEKALIISDCEGYELDLFTDKVIKQLKQHDFLIETHDCINLEISSVLRERLKETHDIQVVTSIDDIQKSIYYQYPELSGYSQKERYYLLAEERGAVMEWFYAKSKS